MATKLTPTEKTIRDFLLEVFEQMFSDQQLPDLGPQDTLLGDGLLDSMAILHTVTFCEQTFDISIPDEELLPDRFENLRAIAQLVERQIADKHAVQ
jgi:acyl carrier protein